MTVGDRHHDDVTVGESRRISVCVEAAVASRMEVDHHRRQFGVAVLAKTFR
jgi:hypothetical protein